MQFVTNPNQSYTLTKEERLEPNIQWDIKKRCHTTAYLTAIFGGMFGIHRFYLRKELGELMMLSTWVAIILFVLSIPLGDYQISGYMLGTSLLILFCVTVVLMFDIWQMHEYIDDCNISIANEIIEHYNRMQRGEIHRTRHGDIHRKQRGRIGKKWTWSAER